MKIKILLTCFALGLTLTCAKVYAQSYTLGDTLVVRHPLPSVVDYDLPVQIQTPDVDDKYLAFLFYGDGNYEYVQIPDTQGASFQHTYLRAGNYRPYLEATLVYDDTKNPPPAIMFPGGSTPSDITTSINSSIQENNTSAGLGRSIYVQPTRKIVSGHRITFIITIVPQGFQENCQIDSTELFNGKVKFQFDSTFFIFDSLVNYPNSNLHLLNEPDSEAQNGVSISTLTIHFSNLKVFEHKNIFLQFVTNPEKNYGDQTTYLPRASVFGESSRTNCQFNDTYILLNYNTVGNSHDPNNKLENRTVLSLDDKGEINYTIFFQNEGNADVNEVTIIDELDRQWDCNCQFFQNINSSNERHFILSPIGTNIKDVNFNPVDNKLIIKLGNLNLKGLADTKFGIEFNETATKGQVSFKIPTRCLRRPQPPCGMISNSAGIIFGCNPPIQTAIAKISLLCDSIENEKEKNRCVDSLIIIDQTLFEIGRPVLPIELANWLNANFTSFNWYPGTAVSQNNPFALFKGVYQENIMLTASKSCERVVIFLHTKPSCNLKLSYTTQTNAPSSFEEISYDIEVIATGFSDINHLQWNSCNKYGINSIFLKNVTPERYYFGVTDHSTGCWRELWVDLKQPALLVDDDPNDHVFVPFIAGGQPPYKMHWNHGVLDLFEGIVLDFSEFLPEEEIVIEDENGLKVHFKPKFE